VQVAYDLNTLGGIAIELGDYIKAERCFREALNHAQEIVHPYTPAIAIAGLGDVARARGDEQGAEAHYQRALALSPVPNINLPGHILLRQARRVLEEGDVALGVELAALVQHHPLVDDETRERAQRLLGDWEDRLSADAFAAARESGIDQTRLVA
jgi:tetratricopeptide (TPR) repeat protein